MDKVYRALELQHSSNESVAMLYLDFSKAYDKVSYWKLIEKVEQMNIGGNLLRLFGSYLSSRRQSMQINSDNSEELLVTSGVPQGSILGPLLFPIFLMTSRITV